MAIELTEWCGNQKTKEPDTFRAPFLEYGFEHLLSIFLAAFLNHGFMLYRRRHFSMWM